MSHLALLAASVCAHECRQPTQCCHLTQTLHVQPLTSRQWCSLHIESVCTVYRADLEVRT